MLIRRAREHDDEALWNLLNGLDHETVFMLYEPGERKKDLERLKKLIQQSVKGSDLLLVAQPVEEGEIIGFLSAVRGGTNRIRHTAYLVLGIRKAYGGQGIGKRLLGEAERWAISQGIHRLELTVVCANKPAVHLYETCGFQVEGVRRCAMGYGDHHEDEYYMAKLLKLDQASD